MKARLWAIAGDATRVALWTVMISLVGAMLMFHVWNQYRITEAGYEIARVTAEHRKLLERNKLLSIEAAVVGRTERLTTVAKQRYGLQPVAPEQVREVRLIEDEPHAALEVAR